ncbi:MAG: FAD-binding protein [Proteobacteria bacterium]|nr:FAD-binding protein [Pseudomonadota bacterium]MBU1904266.1 FAD-binding protein [Pseudomonadota bacterium]
MGDASINDIWVFGDLRDQRLFGFSLNVLSKARELSRTVRGKTVAVCLGQSGENPEASAMTATHIRIDAAEKACIAHGADLVYSLENRGFVPPRCDTYSRALADLIGERSPMLVLFPLTDFGREIAARTARIRNAGLIADCAGLRVDSDGIIGECPAWDGQVMAEISFSEGCVTGFATVQPHVHSPVDVPGEPGTIERIQVERVHQTSGLRLLACSPEPAERRMLEEAKTVVVGGAGLGNMEGFGLVRQLAAAVGGEVAATRPPVLQHWIEEERMIGQTGKTVRPDLLFSIGTSGAVQYTAGIAEAKTIVAINRDPNAPIFQVADLGVVADAKTFMPLLIARTKNTVMRRLADALRHDEAAQAREVGFGEKIGKLREGQGWSRESLAEATGQTPDFIAQVESDDISPPVSFLVRLAGAFGVDPGTFLHKEEQAVIRDQRAQAFIKRTRSYSYQTLTPGAEKSHLRAFMVTIESHHSHKPVEYKHEGEEFIYVMEGDLEFTLGGKTHVLKKGECIHFNSDIPHKLKSLSNEPTRCLVMLYTV